MTQLSIHIGPSTQWEPLFRALNAIGDVAPTPVVWEDAGMDRLQGAPQAIDFVRTRTAITPPDAAFDSAFSTRTER